MGSRFWPVSTPERPKQLLPLAGERPLVVETVERARALVPDARIRILAGQHLVGPFRRVMPDLPSDTYLVEPAARGTAPVLAWAAWTLARQDPDAVLVSLHSDHLVRPLERFVETVAGAARIALRERLLLTVGVRPDRPEIGYGYIQPGAPLEAPEGLEAFRVEAFHEKPDAATAQRYVKEGYLWNTGIFLWPAAVFLEEMERHAPDIAEHLPLLESGDPSAFFDAVPNRSVDVAVMERSRRVGVVPATFDWDDVGAWHSLHRTRDGDARGNVLIGDAHVHEGSNNVVYAEDGAVVVFGLDDVVAVRTGGVTLVAPRDRAAELKTLLDHLPEHLRRDP